MTTTRSLIRRAAIEALEGRVFMHAGHDHVLPTPLPHLDDAGKQQEHLAMLDLVPESEATAVAVRSGGWSKRNTWRDRVVPGLDAKVLIPAKVTVKVDRQFPTEFEWVRVKGTLAFASKANTLLKVDTIVVDPGGQYVMGTSRDPVRAKYTASVVFTDDGPLDPARDPLQLSRGLLAHGTARIAGAKTTSHVNLAKPAVAGDSVLHLATAPTGWKVGGRIVVPDVYGEMKDEERTILAIKKNVVTLSSPLAQHHTLDAESGVKVPVAYLDRNVRFTSENAADVSRRGHVMFMHSPDVQVADAQFEALGRTRNDIDVTDAQLDAAGAVVPGTDLNVRGRYALHFHRTGATTPATARGVSVVDATKFGVVNHDGNVAVEDSLVFRGNGSGFFTESGNELGAFRRNLAVGVRGLGDPQVAVEHFQNATGPGRVMRDFGRQGNGFWFQGTLVQATDNLAVGNAFAGYAFMPVGLTDDPMASRVAAANLPADVAAASYDPRAAGADTEVLAFEAVGGASFGFRGIPVRAFRGNTTVGSPTGILLRVLGAPGAFAQRNVFEDFTAVNISQYAVRASYSSNFTFVNPRLFGGSLVGSPALADKGDGEWWWYGLGQAGFLTNSVATDQEVVGGVIRNFQTGIAAPMAGDFRASGTLLDNPRNVAVDTVPDGTLARTVRLDRLVLRHTGRPLHGWIPTDLRLEGNSGSPADQVYWDGVAVPWPSYGPSVWGVSTWLAGMVPGVDPGRS